MRTLCGLALLAQTLAAQGFVQVSQSNPRYLELSTGESYIPIGLNIAFERFATDEVEVFANTERRFRALAGNGGNFARVWLSHPFYAIDESTTGAELQTKLRRLDRLIELARQNRLRLKLCLEHFRTLDKEQALFPGSVTFGRPGLAAEFRDMAGYLASPRGRALYLQKIDLLARRYRDEPVVFGWELWNEMNAVRGGEWEKWTRVMLRELKQRLPRHLSLQSLGGFEDEQAIEIYRRVSSMPGNEVAQVHRYMNPGASWEIAKAPMDVLAADAVARVLSYAPDRPVLLAEVGAVEARHSGPSKMYPLDRDGVLLHDGLFAGFFAGAAGPGHFWHWQDYVEKNDVWHHFEDVPEVVGS